MSAPDESNSAVAMTPAIASLLGVAEQFADMARLSNIDNREHSSPPRRIVAQSAILAFAIELMLKALHEADLQKRGHGHDLWKLYKILPSSTKDGLIWEFTEGAHDNDKAMDALRVSMGLPVLSLEEEIRQGRDLFVKLRYAHEGLEIMGFGLGQVMAALRRYLFKRYPSEGVWLSGLNG